MKTDLILIVDDDPHLREIVRFALDKEGFPSLQAKDGREALDMFAAHAPTLIVLDITMPELNGTDVCREIRKTSDVPIIFLSSRDDELDRILGLELGGDDYMTKPFSPRELAARVKAMSRRMAALRNAEKKAAAQPSGAQPASEILTHGKLTLDLTTCKAFHDGREVVLTVMEFGVLRALMDHPKKVYSRDELMTKAYDDNTVVSDRTIDSHIRRIRKKFAAVGADPIETVTGFGYRMAPSQVPLKAGTAAAARAKFRPRIRTVLLVVNLVILLLPLVGIQALKLYENELIHQTEAALAAQGAYVREQLRSEIARRIATGPAAEALLHGHETDPRFRREDGSSGEFYEPLQPDINVYRERVRPPAEDPKIATLLPDRLMSDAAAPLSPLLLQTQRYTLTGVRVLDHRGVAVASSRGEIGFAFADREEVRRALEGETVGFLRERVSDEPSPGLSSMSRGSRVRVFLALPVVLDNRVYGAILLSRTPLDIQKALYLQRFALLRYAFGLLVIVLFVSLLTAKTISRPIEALIEQADAVKLGRASKPVEKPGSREVDELSRAIDSMARTLKERASYIETFARNVSHEFKTPLATFQGTVELLKDHADTMTKAEREKFLGMIGSDAARMERLVERLLHLARADVATPAGESTPVTPTLEAAVRRARDQGLNCELAAEPGQDPRCALSREALESIISNLLENAKTHGGPSVKVTVRLASGGPRTNPIRITVEDDGPGISAANRARVFDAFFTTARAAGGTGLGLAIVRALAEAHGGRVELDERESGRGAAFSVYLLQR